MKWNSQVTVSRDTGARRGRESEQGEIGVYKQTPCNKFVFSRCQVPRPSLWLSVRSVLFGLACARAVAINFTECYEPLIRLANGACNLAEAKPTALWIADTTEAKRNSKCFDKALIEVSVCACVCVWETEKERETIWLCNWASTYMCVFAFVWKYDSVWIWLLVYICIIYVHMCFSPFLSILFSWSESFLAAANLPPKARLRLLLGTPLFSVSVSDWMEVKWALLWWVSRSKWLHNQTWPRIERSLRSCDLLSST